MTTFPSAKLTKAQALAIERARLGPCRSMVQKSKRAEPYPCRNWAVNERGYCGVHYATEVERELKAERAASARELLLAGIDAWIAAEPERQQELLDWLAERQEYEDPSSIGVFD